MILFLYGKDNYRSRQKLNEIIESYKKIHKSGLNLNYFEGEKANFQDFRDEMRQASMFKEKKLAVLRDIFSNSEFKENFLKNFKDYLSPEDAILFYENQEISENEPLFKLLKKYAVFQEFKPLGGQLLKSWIKKEFENYQTQIEARALEKLINYIGNDLWQQSNEIKKLASFKRGPASAKASAGKERIESKDIELLVKPKIETDIFKTIDAIASKNKKEALSLVHKHIEKGDSPLYLFSMINFQFRNLLIIKDLIEKQKPFYVFSKITKLHPYVIKKSYNLAQKFTFPELKKIYQKLFDLDFKIKTGKIEPKMALEIFIAEI